MPKIAAGLGDVSVDYKLPEPKTHLFKLKKIETIKLGVAPNGVDRIMYKLESRIIDPDGEDNNKPCYENCNFHQKDGDLNEAGQRDFKRYAIAIVGEDEANDPEFDTDQMLEGMFTAEVYHDAWEDKGKKGVSAKINTTTITAYEA